LYQQFPWRKPLSLKMTPHVEAQKQILGQGMMSDPAIKSYPL